MVRSVVAAALTSAALIGCGEAGPALVPVSGTLSFNGQPLDGADLTFIPGPENVEPTPGSAKSDSSGEYTAMYRDRRGLAAGKYKVVVSKRLVPAGQKIPEAFKDEPEMLAMPELGLSKNSLPASYTDASKTPLSMDVSPQGGTFDFDVKGASPKP